MTYKCLLSVCIILIVFVMIIVSVQASLSPYLSWLKTLDRVLQVPPQPDFDCLQFPLDIREISFEDIPEQRSPLDDIVEVEIEQQECCNVTCLHEPTKPLEYYRVLLNDTQVSSSRSTLIISFPVNSSEDIYTLIVPFIHSASSNQTNWSPQLNISLEKSGNAIRYVGFSSNGGMVKVSGNLQEVANYQISQSQQPTNISYQLASEFTENQLLIFVDGLLWRRYEITDVPPYTVSVTFADDSVSGYTPDIKLYNTLATTGELYSLSYGVAIPERLVRPDCECPRPYMDTYSLMKKSRTNESVPENLCYGASDGTVPRYTNQYQGIWAIFTADGWVSDFADAVAIEIKMPQTMLIYGVSGKFMWKAGRGEADAIQRPNWIELYLSKLLVHVYTDCPSVIRHDPIVMYEHHDGTLRKCLNWDQVITSRGIINGYNYVTWEMQVLSDMQEGERLDDTFASDDIEVYLIGHSNSTGGTQNRYHVSELSIFTRPHCGGSEYELLNPPPSNIAEYTEFFSDGTKAYHCLCPEMMEDDRCENCRTSTQPYRYKTKDLLCLDCDCTDLSLSKSCDYSTVQCPCRPLNNSVLSQGNLKCEWRVTEIVPSYGPIAGGTLIRVKGDYITWPEVNITTASFGGEIVQVENRGSELTIVSPARAVSGDVDVILQPSTALNVGAVTSPTIFNYRSNPVIYGFEYRGTIFSGGIRQFIYGVFMDVVAEPMLYTYVTEELLNGTKIQHQFTSKCSVINSSTLVCLTPDLSKSIQQPEEMDYLTKSPLPNVRIGVITLVSDGVTQYAHLSKNPEFHVPYGLEIYADPIIDELKKVLVYTLDDETILLKGKRMDWGAGIEDYSIEIGGWGACDVVNLTSDTLLCTPPSDIPQVRQVTDYECHEGWPSPYIKVSVGNYKTSAGYIYYKDYVNISESVIPTSSTFLDTVTKNYLRTGLAVLGSILTLIVVGVVIYFTIRRRQNLEANENDPTLVTIKEIMSQIQHQGLSSRLKSKVERCKIPKERLSIGQQIGEGHFGLVFNGQLVTASGCVKNVAIKCLKDDKDMSFEDLEMFLSEATLMIDFKHKNVMSLLGVVYEVGERPLVVLPYMEKGDLHSFIVQDHLDFVLGDMLHFAYQISNGMAYLASKQFVHRDLACRNCMLNDLNIVKIADFGMSKDIDEKKYYRMASMNKPLPIRWMAVESMKYGIFTVKSDVWSYGVTLWELLTRGILPFTGITNQQVKEHIIIGARLCQPITCPPVMYDMMKKCWDEYPQNRPEFTDISGMIKGLLTGETTPKAGSGPIEGYYYNRNVTNEVPVNYVNAVDDSDDDYITVLDDAVETQVYTIL